VKRESDAVVQGGSVVVVQGVVDNEFTEGVV